MSHVLVQADNLCKRYKLYARPRDRLIEWLSLGNIQKHGEFWALRDFSLRVEAGECVGIIGSNGAGKSTLLRILGNTLIPTSGTFRVDGRALSLLELGTGFNPELTGRLNIHNTAQLLGLPIDYASSRMPQIEQFADLGEFLDRPIKTYSTGMTLRLAFSMFAFFEPDVLVIDEALAVGDVSFQRKCFRRMQELVEDSSRAVILVSHDLQSITRLCNRVYWIHHGRLKMSGEPAAIVQEYLRSMFTTAPTAEPEAPKVEHPPATESSDSQKELLPDADYLRQSPAAIHYPPGGAELLGLWLEDATGRATSGPTVAVDAPFSVCYAVRFTTSVKNPVLGIRLATTRGECLIATNTKMMDVETGEFSAGDRLVVRWPILPGLGTGDYFVSCGCSWPDNLLKFLMRQVDAYQVSVSGPWRQSGLCSLNGSPRVGRIK